MCCGGKMAKCPRCGSSDSFQNVGQLRECEKLPSSSVCGRCKKELYDFEQEVGAGGVYWRCTDCRREGVIKKSPFADEVRKKLERPTEPCGVEFSRDTGCPSCSSKSRIVQSEKEE